MNIVNAYRAVLEPQGKGEQDVKKIERSVDDTLNTSEAEVENEKRKSEYF